MPGKNLEKTYAEESFYHIYTRGVNKEKIFRDEEDYEVLLNLFKRYLSDKPSKDEKGREYPWYQKDIEVLAYCLMPNHVHILVYQNTRDAMTQLMRSLMTTYGMYFNKKYKRVGPIFQSRFRAAMIDKDNYLLHISRYIHLNAKAYSDWPHNLQHSSLEDYLGQRSTEWLKPQRILELFSGPSSYQKFLNDYKDYKQTLDEVKRELAAT